jgi:CubicO group peptidase (beta-lactamase class C family)
MSAILSSYVDNGALPGLVALVSRRGEVHVDAIGMQSIGGSEPMRRDTIFRISSMTKPIAAAAAMILVEECRLRLDDPVDRFLPELANRRVLKRLDGPLDDTVPAKRSITLRDLLTLRMGMGHIMAYAQDYPIRKALDAYGLLPGPPQPQAEPAPDEWMRKVGTLPLMHQPGERWMYDLGLDVLGVLIARAVGQPLDAFMRERIFAPLGMHDTGFHVPSEKRVRLATSYAANPETRALEIYDGVDDSQWGRPPAFPAAASGLVSTVDDYLAFCRMMLNKGKHGNERILSRPSVELMTADHLTPEQKSGMDIFFRGNSGWGFGMAVFTHRDGLATTPGRFGWDGGLGTSAYSDPKEDLVGILMTQRMMDSPDPPGVFTDFWTSAYQAIDD